MSHGYESDPVYQVLVAIYHFSILEFHLALKQIENKSNQAVVCAP
jgi:hypothetical protein